MDKFTVLDGLVAPLDRANVDTDQIIPQKHLQSIKRSGFGDACFAAWRRDPEFVLNQPGMHNVQNACSAIAIAREIGIEDAGLVP